MIENGTFLWVDGSMNEGTCKNSKTNSKGCSSYKIANLKLELFMLLIIFDSIFRINIIFNK